MSVVGDEMTCSGGGSGGGIDIGIDGIRLPSFIAAIVHTSAAVMVAAKELPDASFQRMKILDLRW
jgi:hypothetical protein